MVETSRGVHGGGNGGNHAMLVRSNVGAKVPRSAIVRHPKNWTL